MASITRKAKSSFPSIKGSHAAEALVGSTTKIRLIEILPGTEQIECRFHVYSITRCPKFTALSYTWGPETPTYPISVDGHSLYVRENLRDALLELRQDAQKLRLVARFSRNPPSSTDMVDKSTDVYSRNMYWIDQICINQTDVAERNHQVGLMKDIYSGATLVLIWLGVSKNAVAESVVISLIKENGHQERSLEPRSLTDEGNEALLDICNRPYWKRMWIVQEIMLAQRAVIQLGAQTFLFDNFVRSMYWHSFREVAAHKLIWTKETLDSHLEAKHPLTLRMLVTLCSEQECSEVRDKIFGLFSLITLSSTARPISASRRLMTLLKPRQLQKAVNSENRIDRVPEADYAKSTLEVYLLALQIACNQDFLHSRDLTDFCIRLQDLFKLDQFSSYLAAVKIAASQYQLLGQELIHFCFWLQEEMKWRPSPEQQDTICEIISSEVRTTVASGYGESIPAGISRKWQGGYSPINIYPTRLVSVIWQPELSSWWSPIPSKASRHLDRPEVWRKIFQCLPFVRKPPWGTKGDFVDVRLIWMAVYDPSLLIPEGWDVPTGLTHRLATLRERLVTVDPITALDLLIAPELSVLRVWLYKEMESQRVLIDGSRGGRSQMNLKEDFCELLESRL